MESTKELIFVPAPGAGHMVPALEIANRLVARDSRVSVTILLLKLPTQSAKNPTIAGSDRIKFVDLPRDDIPQDSTPLSFFNTFFHGQKRHVSDAVRKISSSGSARVVGFVLDMFCTAMIEVADEFAIPSYVFFTSGAGLLTMMTTINDLNEVEDERTVPGFANPVPKNGLPTMLLKEATTLLYKNICRGIKKSKGVLVNTFEELEPGIINALDSLNRVHNFPPVYTVGPIINFGESERKAEIMEWLDGQPASSVVFLCFGSRGSFGGDQVREIAIALERSGVRFLWSLRRPEKTDTKIPTPTEYENPEEILPKGFLERTVGIGKVVGWAPQVAVLDHPAVGGFVSHCGWNSTLESIWFGVPVGTWPLYAEQHLNAFEMATELGLAVEISLGTRLDFFTTDSQTSIDTESQGLVVKAERIERGILQLMESESDVRKRVKETSEKSRIALLPGGSSYISLTKFIDEVMDV